MRIIRKQLDIKLGQFMQEKLKIEKQEGLMKYPQKYGRPGNLTTYCSNTVMLYITRTQ